MTAPRLDVARYQGDLSNPDIATAQTVRVMAALIDRASKDPRLRRAAGRAVGRFKGGPLYYMAGVRAWDNPAAIAESSFWWVKHALHFVHHEALLRVWFGAKDELQLLISPDLLLWMRQLKGDCAIYTMLLAAFLKAWGVRFEIVTAAVNPAEPDVFSHVYLRAVMPDGSPIVLDASHGPYAGWEVPADRVLRKQVWDESGDPVPDVRRRFNGLHAYVVRPIIPLSPFERASLVQRMRRRGLGQTSSDDPGAPGGGDVTSTTTVSSWFPGAGSGTTSAPGSGPSFWTQEFANLLNQGVSLAGKVFAPTTTIQSGPGGTFVQTPAGSPVPTGALLTPFAAGASGGSWVWLLGGGLLLVVLLKTLGGRR